MKVNPEDVPRIVFDVLESLKYCGRCDEMKARYTLVTRNMGHYVFNAAQIVRDGLQSFPVKEVICEGCIINYGIAMAG